MSARVWMRRLRVLSAGSNRRATANARVASIECSRRRLERAEVAAYLAARVPAPRTA